MSEEEVKSQKTKEACQYTDEFSDAVERQIHSSDEAMRMIQQVIEACRALPRRSGLDEHLHTGSPQSNCTNSRTDARNTGSLKTNPLKKNLAKTNSPKESTVKKSVKKSTVKERLARRNPHNKETVSTIASGTITKPQVLTSMERTNSISSRRIEERTEKKAERTVPSLSSADLKPEVKNNLDSGLVQGLATSATAYSTNCERSTPREFAPKMETDILKERDPNEIDFNNWPSYVLAEVTVKNPKTGELTSLLSADAQVPLMVTGCLSEIEEEYKQNLISSEPLRSFIQLKDVRTFCHNPEEDGGIALWALGQCGWFHVVPAKQYQAIYDQMVQDIRLLYYVQNFYDFESLEGKRGRKQLSGSAQDLYTRYAREHADCQDADAARALFHGRREFLIASMVKKDPEKPWDRTPFLYHMRHYFPDDFRRLAALKQITEIDAGTTSNQNASPHSKAVALATRAEMSQACRGQTSLGSQITNKHKSKYRYIWGRIKESRRKGEFLRANMSVETYGKMLYRDHEIESPEVGAKIIEAYGPEILRLMSEAKSAGFDWTKRRIYKQLSQLGQPDLHRQAYRSIKLRPRQQALSGSLHSSQAKRKSHGDVESEIVEGGNVKKVGSENKTVKPRRFVKDEVVEPARVLPAGDKIRSATTPTDATNATDATRTTSRDMAHSVSKPSKEKLGKPVVSQNRRALRSPSPLDLTNDSSTSFKSTSRNQTHSLEETNRSSPQVNMPSRSRNEGPTYLIDEEDDEVVVVKKSGHILQNKQSTRTRLGIANDESEVEDSVSRPAKREREDDSPPPFRSITPWWEKNKPSTPGNLVRQPLPQTQYNKKALGCPWTCHVSGCFRKIWGADTMEGQMKIEAHLKDEHYEPERERRNKERKYKGLPERGDDEVILF